MGQKYMARSAMDWGEKRLTDAIEDGRLVLLDDTSGVSPSLLIDGPAGLDGETETPAPVLKGSIPRADMDWGNPKQVDAVARGDLALTDA